jgi:hypothetical protein
MPYAVVTRRAAARAFSRRDLVQRRDVGTRDVLQVDVSRSGNRTDVHWRLDAVLVKSDDDSDVDDLLEALQDLYDVATTAHSMSVAGTPPTPATALDLAKRTITGFDHLREVFSGERTTVHLGALRLPVTIHQRGGRPVKLRASVQLDAHWFCDEPDDLPWRSGPGDGNFAWFELENLVVDTHQCARQGSFDIEAPWAGASTSAEDHLRKQLPDQGVDGRVFMLPTGAEDRMGWFPRPLASCETTVDADQTEVTFDVSMNAIVDDLLLVVCREVILTLVVEEVAPEDPGGTHVPPDEDAHADDDPREE